MGNDDTESWFKEWRNEIVKKLDALAVGQEKLAVKINEIEKNFASQSQIDKIVAEHKVAYALLEERLHKIENVYLKAIGAGFAIQFIFGLILAFLKLKE
jgi:hypothetical protein